jgi:hypothetical protein
VQSHGEALTGEGVEDATASSGDGSGTDTPFHVVSYQRGKNDCAKFAQILFVMSLVPFASDFSCGWGRYDQAGSVRAIFNYKSQIWNAIGTNVVRICMNYDSTIWLRHG